MKQIAWLICVLSCFFADSAEGLRLRVHGGSSAKPTNFNYVVGLEIVIGGFFKTEASCTGGIIHEKYILTAAHCFTKNGRKNSNVTYSQEFIKSQVTVVANALKLFKKSKDRIEVKAKKVYFLPEYMRRGISDIAVLELEHPLNVIEKLSLPGPSLDGIPPGTPSSYQNAVAVLAGYGEDKIGKNDNSLKMTYVRVVSPMKCIEFYGGSKVDRMRNICGVSVTPTNQQPQGPLGGCQGDSGAPLVKGNTVIAVFAATGKSCDGRDNAHPQVYTRVSHYNKFIKNTINGETRGVIVKEF